MVWPFDETIDALNALYVWLESIFNSLVDLPWTIATYMMATAMTVFYPFIAILDIVYSFVQNQYEILAAFINAIIGIPNFIQYTFNLVITMNFPPFLVWVFVTLFMIRLSQFVYKHVKGVSILGFKVG